MNAATLGSTTRLEGAATCAGNRRLHVIWMNTSFHVLLLYQCPGRNHQFGLLRVQRLSIETQFREPDPTPLVCHVIGLSISVALTSSRRRRIQAEPGRSFEPA